MDLEAFKASLADDTPPQGIGRALAALWHEARGEWKQAHRLAQAQGDEIGAWVHAYLHRVEGNLTNADHWYRRAGRPCPAAPLAEEWETIAAALLASQPDTTPGVGS